MPSGALAERVDTLEIYMKDLSFQALKTEQEIARLSYEMREFKEEMRGFKNEMRSFKDEMGAFKDEMRSFKDEMGIFKDEMGIFKDEMGIFKDEMSTFKDEMGIFKDEMRSFKDQSEQDRRAMNRKWGELANKMGTMVEDLVAPNLPRLARELFGCEEPESFATRIRKRVGANTMELDVLLVCEGIVLINETKSNLIVRDIDDLMAKLELFPRFYPELEGRRRVGLVASLSVNENVVRYATTRGILVMAMGDETMQVLNPEVASEIDVSR